VTVDLSQRLFVRAASIVSPNRLVPFAPLGVLLALSLPAWIRLFDPTVNVWREYDGANHMVRTYLLSRAWDRGEWFPRWSPEQYGGYGYPTLNFYAPLVYVLVAALARVLPGDTAIYDAYVVASAGFALVLFAGTYALGYVVSRHKPVAVLAACLVAYGPYALIPNLYVFGSAPHVAGLGLMAWLLVALHEGWSPSAQPWWRRGWWWATAAIVGLLMLTHGVSAVLSVVIGGGWVVALFVRRPDWRAFVRVVAAGVVGVSLSAFFWIPSVLDAPLVQTERLQLGALNFRNWFTIWPGYHPDNWGEQARSEFVQGIPIDVHLGYPHMSTGPSRLGLWQAVVLVAAIAYLGRAWLKRGREANNSATVPVAFGVGMALFLWVQQFDWAIPLWERFTILQLIQMPSRMFGPLAFAVAIAFAGVAGTLVPRGGWRTWAWVVLVGAAMSYFGTLDRGTFNDDVIDRRVDDRALDALERLDPGYTASTNEFLPRTANIQTWLGDEARGFWLYDRMYPEAGWVAGQVMAWQGDIGIRQVWQEGLTWVADVRVGPTDGLASDLAFHQLYFPGWRAWVDGVPVDPRPAPIVVAQAFEPGFILVPVPEGEHRVTLRFGPDGPRAAGAAISVVAGLVVAGLLGGVAVRSGLISRVVIAPVVIGLVMASTLGGLGTWRATRMPGGTLSWLDPVLEARIVESLTDAVLEESAQVKSPTGAERGRGKYVDIKPLAIRAQDKPLRDAGVIFRRLLFVHPPTIVTVDVDVPVTRNGDHAYLQSAMAIDPEVWNAPLGDGVRFMVVASARQRAGGPPLANITPEVTILDDVMNPRADGNQRRWVDVLVPLDQWTGERVRLQLMTDPREEPSSDWAGWGEPQVVVLDPMVAGRMTRGAAWEAKVALVG
jgi:hypothetical protein